MHRLQALTRWGLRGVFLVVLLLATVAFAFALEARLTLPDLRPWHRLVLAGEFRAGREDVGSFDEYLLLEERLFAELREEWIDDPRRTDPYALGRYHPGSAPCRLALETPYNRSYELAPADPRGAVLLVHGLTDSPYSMRALAEIFFAEGFHVVVLRLPGHGTVPSMLREATRKDWQAAVELAASHAASRAGPDEPFYAVGYSMGAALVTLHALRAIDDPALPRPHRLFLLSPAIGLSKMAVLTNVMSGFSFVPGFETSDWLEVYPEYDPYKYNSFPVHAANQIYRLTRDLDRALAGAGETGRLAEMPPITVFHSLIDATVRTDDVLRNLLSRLPAGGHELVLFDVNRHDTLHGLIAEAPLRALEEMKNAPALPFRASLIANRNASSAEVAEYSRAAGSREVAVRDLPLAWPAGVYSLGHVAIPFPSDDPVYGLAPAPLAGDGPRFPIGSFSARGESGALLVPLDLLARLRSNPFFDVVREKIVAACNEDRSPVPTDASRTP